MHAWSSYFFGTKKFDGIHLDLGLLIHPPLSYCKHFNNWYQRLVACEDSLKVLKLKIKRYRKEVRKLNKENFPTRKILMNLHISSIGVT